MTTSQMDQIFSTLSRIADALEAIVSSKTPLPSDAAVPASPWTSPDCPTGFNTVVGHLATNHPEVLDLMSDPVTDTLRDGYWLSHQASKRGIATVKVAAPLPFKDLGIEEVNAYPEELLAERLN